MDTLVGIRRVRRGDWHSVAWLEARVFPARSGQLYAMDENVCALFARIEETDGADHIMLDRPRVRPLGYLYYVVEGSEGSKRAKIVEIVAEGQHSRAIKKRLRERFILHCRRRGLIPQQSFGERYLRLFSWSRSHSPVETSTPLYI